LFLIANYLEGGVQRDVQPATIVQSVSIPCDRSPRSKRLFRRRRMCGQLWLDRVYMRLNVVRDYLPDALRVHFEIVVNDPVPNVDYLAPGSGRKFRALLRTHLRRSLANDRHEVCDG